MRRYIAVEWDWPLACPCRFCVLDTVTGSYVLFPDHRGNMYPNMRTMAAAERRAARLNRGLRA